MIWDNVSKFNERVALERLTGYRRLLLAWYLDPYAN